MLTRREVAEKLGKSVATVRRLEGSRLHPQVTARGMRLFDPDEIAAFAKEVHDTGRALSPAQRSVSEIGSPTWNECDELQEQLEAAQDECQKLRTLLDASSAQAESTERQLERLRREVREWAALIDQGCALLIQAEYEETQMIAIDALVRVMSEVPT